MPAADALPNPLAKQVMQAEGAWLVNYTRYPWMMVAPALGFVGALGAVLMARAHRPGLAFTSSSVSMAGIILTAGFSMFPFIMPSITVPNGSLTLWDAPSSHLTLTVMFWAAMIFVPIILAYTTWCYRSLWGKTSVQFIRDNNYDAY